MNQAPAAYRRGPLRCPSHVRPWLQEPQPNVSGNSLTVYLSKTVTAPAKVAWFIVN
jgi:hypothetical protein